MPGNILLENYYKIICPIWSSRVQGSKSNSKNAPAVLSDHWREVQELSSEDVSYVTCGDFCHSAGPILSFPGYLGLVYIPHSTATRERKTNREGLQTGRNICLALHYAIWLSSQDVGKGSPLGSFPKWERDVRHLFEGTVASLANIWPGCRCGQVKHC